MSSWFWSSSADQSGSEPSSVSEQMGSLSCPKPTCVSVSFIIFSRCCNRLSWFISASPASWPTWATWQASWLFELEPGSGPLGVSSSKYFCFDFGRFSQGLTQCSSCGVASTLSCTGGVAVGVRLALECFLLEEFVSPIIRSCSEKPLKI